MCVSPVRLGDEELGGLEAGFEAHVALAAKEGFVAPGLGKGHGLVHPLFVSD